MGIGERAGEGMAEYFVCAVVGRGCSEDVIGVRLSEEGLSGACQLCGLAVAVGLEAVDMATVVSEL